MRKPRAVPEVLLSPIISRQRVLVAVSGGADSLALLKLLHEANFEVVAAHINHGLRGRESDDDEIFVRDLCARENIEYSSRRVHLESRGLESRGLESRGGYFSEDEARRKRYAALVEIAIEKHCEQIATGHTADDNLETILLHLARGATVNGWNGIPPTRAIDANLQIVRPILHLTRAQTEAICRDVNWHWRSDSTNSSTLLARNHVRHEIVPLLAQIGHKTRAVLARQTSRGAQIRRDENDFLDELATVELENLQLKGRPSAFTFDGERWTELPIALQRRVLRLALRKFDTSDLGLEHSEEIRRHVSAREKRRVWCLPRGVRLEWTGAMSGNRVRLWRVE